MKGRNSIESHTPLTHSCPEKVCSEMQPLPPNRSKASFRIRLPAAALAALSVVASIVPALDAEPVFSIDTSNREEVRQFYRSVYYASEGIPMAWTGSYAPPGDPGETSEAWREAVRLRINFFRALAGVPAWVDFDPEKNAKAQRGALIISGEHRRAVAAGEPFELPHNPTPSWPFFTEEGKDAARNSNIAVNAAGSRAVDSYARESGAQNRRVGHRRWMLHPPHRVMGSGDVAGGGGFAAANLVWTFDDHTFDPYPELRDGFVAWPPKGYVPAPLSCQRWSFAAENADFADATVAVRRDGTHVSTRVEHRPGPPRDEVGAHLVWNLGDGDSGCPRPLVGVGESDAPFEVRLTGAAGAAVEEYRYTTVFFDPYGPGDPQSLPRILGDGRMWRETANPVTVRVPPFADSKRLRQVRITPATWVENVSRGERFEIATFHNAPIIEFEGSKNNSVLFLGHPPPNEIGERQSEIATLKNRFMVNPGGTLRLRHRLNHASENQVALVEVSTHPERKLWEVVWKKRGRNDGQPIMDGFEEIAIPLSDYADRTIHLRFRYLLEIDAGGSAGYFPRDHEGWLLGWAVDEIRFSHVAEAEVLHTFEQGIGGTFHVTPDATDIVAFQAGATAFGGFPLEWGEVRVFSVHHGDGHPFMSDPSIEGGWRETPLGLTHTDFWTADRPWVFSELHGFIHVPAEENGYRVFDPGIDAWLHVFRQHPHWLFHHGHRTWLFFPGETRSPDRRFHVPSPPPTITALDAGNWIHERDL